MPLEDVLDWERTEVPKRNRKLVLWTLAAAERDQALARSGLPECHWHPDWELPISATLEELERWTAETNRHARSCETCLRRERFLQERFGDLPDYPTGTGERVLIAFMSVVEPPVGWHRVAAKAGILVSLFGLARLLRHVPPPWSELLGLLVYVFAIAAGVAVAVTVYHWLKPLHGNGLSRWVARCAAGAAGMAGFLGMFDVSGHDLFTMRGDEPIGWGARLTIGAVMGILYATIWSVSDAARKSPGG